MTDQIVAPSARRAMRLLLVLLVLLAVGSWGAESAFAGGVRLKLHVLGAGTVTGPDGFLCESSAQDENAEGAVCEQTFSGAFEITVFLVPAPSGAPAANWRLGGWSGCNVPNAGRPNDCRLVSPALSAPDREVWVQFDDHRPPTATIDSGPSTTLPHGQATFSFHSDEDLGGLTCQVDAGPERDCSSGTASLDVTADGLHTFRVKARDQSGNWGGWAERAWTVDFPPETRLTSGPQRDGWVSSRSAAFAFESPSSDVGPGGFDCRLTGAGGHEWQACSSPRTYGALEQGAHTFQVRARDSTSTDPSPESWDWTVDTIGPTTTLGAHEATPPDGAVLERLTAVFAFDASEPVQWFECSLDGASFGRCSAPVGHVVSRGSHTFRVRAVDRAGNVGAFVTRAWTVAPPDKDADGYNASADCDDSSPSINPGRPEVVNNDVDENCDSRWEFDRDLDGSRADSDCDDANAARTPGKTDVPGNGVDEDCDGLDRLDKMSISLSWTWKNGRFKSLSLNGAPVGSTATVTCSAGTCPKKTITLTTTKAKQPLRTFVGKRFKPGTTLTVTVSQRGYITAVKTLKVRAGKQPTASLQMCLPPGSSSPTQC